MSIELDAGLGICEATPPLVVTSVFSTGLITCRFWELAIEPARYNSRWTVASPVSEPIAYYNSLIQDRRLALADDKARLNVLAPG